MVHVPNVLHWFRDATSETRLDVLCRFLDCCTPFELHFLSTYLDELLSRNMLINNQSELTVNQPTNLTDLHEITNSDTRRQLCILLTKLKSANRIRAYNIYNILIQYDFNKFFSQVITMEEEVVDELLLLFTLASNHPAMTFQQRICLHKRLRELRTEIEKSFECCLIDVYSHDGQEHSCCSYERNNMPPKRSVETIPKVEHDSQPIEPSTKAKPAITEVKENTKGISQVHINDLRVIKVQQRTYDKKYEYVFEVTWSNGKVIRIHRAYGELFDFQCKLRRRHTRESGKYTGRRVIPYLPSRKPIKICKGNDILPDITEYVRDFVQLPDKLLHSESVEKFFSDGNERIMDESNQELVKSNHSEDKNLTCKHSDILSVHGERKTDKGNGLLKKFSPKGKSPSAHFGKKMTAPVNSGKLDLKKRNFNLKDTPNETSTSNKNESKLKTTTLHHGLSSPTSKVMHSPERKTKHVKIVNNKKTVLKSTDENKMSTSKSSVIISTKKPSTSVAVNKTSVAMATSKSLVPITTTNTSDSMTTNKALVSMTITNSTDSVTTSNDPVSLTATKPSVSMTTSTTSVSMTTAEASVSMTTSQTKVPMTTSNPSVTMTTSGSLLSAITTNQSFSHQLESVIDNSACVEPATSNTLTNLDNMSVMTSPLTVAVSPHPYTTCSNCNQFLSDDSLTPPGSPLSSPVVSIIPNERSVSSVSDQEYFDFNMLSNTTSSIPETNYSLKLELCQFEKYEHLFQELTNEELLDKIDSTNARKGHLKENSSQFKQSKNGFNIGRSYDVSQHNPVIVNNGSDESLTNLDDEQHVTLNEAMMDDNILDKNCNYVLQNGGEHNYRSFHLNTTKNYEYKNKTYFNEKSNGFYKPYCYNCGECGHSGERCLKNQLDEPVLT